MYDFSPPVLLGIAVLVVASLVADYVSQSDDTPDEWSMEAAQQAYVAGEIGEAELERRLDRVLDDRARELRDRVEDVRYVGPTTAARIADEFDSVEDLRRAEQNEIESVHGVGESIAEEIEERV